MFKNLTIGKKIGLGFGVVMVFLAATAVLSYRGVGGIVGNASEVIAANKLDGNLAQKEVDHLNWANQVSALLTDDEVTQLSVETDERQCTLGQWLYGAERKEAEAAVPSIAPLLKELERHHAELHASAVDIGAEFTRAHAGLTQKLAEVWSSHLEWVNHCGTALTVETAGLYSYQTLTRNAVDQAYALIAACAEDESLGDIEARQQVALKMVKVVRYGPEGKDYFWINDTQPHMVNAPLQAGIGRQGPQRQRRPQRQEAVCRNGEGV